MRKNKLGDGTCGFAEHVREHIVEFQVGNGQTILSAVLFPGEHIAELGAIANEIAKLADTGRWDKAGTDHTAHEQITDPAGILTVSLVALLRFGVLGVGENDMAGLFEDVEDGNPVLTGGFHTDLNALILVQPLRKLPQTFGEGCETGFVISCSSVGVGDADTGKDPGFVNVKTTAVVKLDFEHGVPPVTYSQERQGLVIRENRVDFTEISLRAVSLRHSLLPLRMTDAIYKCGVAAIQPRHSPPRVL